MFDVAASGQQQGVGVPLASLGDLSTLEGMVGGVGEVGCGLVCPSLPLRVVARLAFAAVTLQGGEQKAWTLPPRVDAGNEVVQWAHAGNGVILESEKRPPA
jgi:hypothetical protein